MAAVAAVAGGGGGGDDDGGGRKRDHGSVSTPRVKRALPGGDVKSVAVDFATLFTCVAFCTAVGCNTLQSGGPTSDVSRTNRTCLPV